MRLLVLGGTVFLGHAVAEQALAAGDQVTCLARGASGAVPAGVELVRADRDDPDGLAGLDGREFDAVIDVARRPSHVRRAVAALAARVGHWCYVSSCSVYADQATPGQRAATAPTLPPAPSNVDNAAGEWYGPCKVACEQAVFSAVEPSRVFNCRAGLIVGPGDPSDRFTYWPVRLARPGPVLVPGAPHDLVQVVDVRDLADWLLLAARQRVAGTFDGMGAPTSRADFLAEVAAGAGRPDAELVWADQEFLAERGVQPWSGERSLPVWLPLPEYGGFLSRDPSASIAAGLTTRGLGQTSRDTLDWHIRAGEPGLSCGLSAADEAELLAETR
jgi:2'-hydroxyisoflavone reductase